MNSITYRGLTRRQVQSHQNFVDGTTLLNLQMYVSWLCMPTDVVKFIQACVFCYASEPTNRNLGLYTLFHVPSQPWESISMNFLSGILKTRHEHDFILAVVDRFNKMKQLILCNKTVSSQEATKQFSSTYGYTLDWLTPSFKIGLVDF